MMAHPEILHAIMNANCVPTVDEAASIHTPHFTSAVLPDHDQSPQLRNLIPSEDAAPVNEGT
jgi:hypothetical protein